MIASGLRPQVSRWGCIPLRISTRLRNGFKSAAKTYPKRDFIDLIDELWPYASAIEQQGDLGVVSVFEMLTAMAFVHFRRVKADFAVIETGLGGRLDATNVVDPEVAVITPISLDHVRILGGKVSLIAREKAGSSSKIARR